MSDVGDGGRRVHLQLVILLVLTGVLAGLIWAWWAPSQPQAYVVGSHRVWGLFSAATIIADEKEGWAASDGRFVVLMLVLGIAAGLFAWLRRDARGSGTALALGLGGLLSSLLAGLVGFLVDIAANNGHVLAKKNELIQTVLTVHAHGLYFLQPATALLIYGICTAFARDDDLGRPEERAHADDPSVGAVGRL